MSRVVLLLGLLLGSTSCVVVDDPNHCWNLERDATCEQLYPGSVCSRCTRGYSGCVERGDVAAECLDDGSSESGTSGTSGTSDSSGDENESESESSGVTACSVEGSSEECPAETPYCVAGSCESCVSAGGDPFCTSIASETPQCHPGWGRCVECDAPEACAGGFCSTAFECGGCSAHEDCPDSACDLGFGTCMVSAPVLWIDDDEATCDDAGSGATAAAPLCSLAEAFGRVGFQGSAILHVAPGSYDGVDLLKSCEDRRIAVLGSGPTTVIHDGAGNVPPLRVCNDAVFLHQVLLHANAGAALNCNGGAQVWLDEAIVEAGFPGIDADGCQLALSRTHVRENATRAIELHSGAHLKMSSSIVSGTTQDGVMTGALLISNSIVDIRSSTFASNEGLDLVCSGSPEGTVSDSVLVSRPDTVGCSSLAIDHSVGTSAIDGEANVTAPYDGEWFVDAAGGDFRLSDAADEFASVGRRELGDPRLDFEGDAWPDVPGAPIYAGADQP